ncbi:acyl-CoA dehydrogenase family protein [Streptomyces sp. MB09-02B]|uniref:acyl-CoA dehydrogenase family protein n=1 Tax=Streptomyces sp. MB09-02B TaxID=3028667 RepID=UPI0029B018B2|nr:acyl-CoA dehydrogenase family protein [Streptomyces sp. MB09-02B]MDX3638441.1 acyl-CoA dehydrogenase family protein [Streptomyces sp. MB09-02B]
MPIAVTDAIAAAFAGLGREAPFAPARSLRLDEQEEFPDAECRLLDSAGAASTYVPAELGGAHGGLPELVETLRTVARHDMTTAVAHGKTFLGAASVWVRGSDAQRRRLADLVLDGAVVSWGLTEPERGSDLLAGRLSATRTGDGGWRLDGEKYLINNATRGRYSCVLARTHPEGGPRGFSLFLVDKEALAPGSWRSLPKQPTHGIRGADISGIAFAGAAVSDDALVGGVGEGIEIVLCALQLTRTICSALSLGAGEHALRMALEFTRDRELYGKVLLELPYARRALATALATLQLAEATATVGARSAHALPAELGVVSAVVKAAVPELVQESIDVCAELLGARGFLTETYAHGEFQKLERDHRIVPIFDGSTAVSRASLINQFPALVRSYQKATYDATALSMTTDASASLPAWDGSLLRVLGRGGCSVVQGLPDMVRRAADGRFHARTVTLAQHLLSSADEVLHRMADVRPTPRDVPAAAFALARRYELCFAGASALGLLLTAVPALRAPGVVDVRLRLEAALARSVQLLDPDDKTSSVICVNVQEELLSAVERAYES